MITSPASYASSAALVSPHWGIYHAVVANNSDPLNEGRVKLKIPQVLGTAISNWAKQADSGAVPAPGATVYTSFLGGDKNRPVYWPTESTAVVASTGLIIPSGDSTGATDTAAIQNALTTTGYALLSTGTFHINATINPTNATMSMIQGQGWNTRINYDGTVVNPAIGMGDSSQRRAVIRDLRLSQTSASSVNTAINMDYFTNSIVDNVLIDGSTHHPNVGISMGTVSQNTHYNVIQNCRINVDGTNAIGVNFAGGSTGAISNVIRNCRILPSTTDASQIGVSVSTRAIEIDHVDIEGAAGTGISITSGGDACTMISPYLEGNGTNLAISGVIEATVVGGTIITGQTADITDSGTATKVFGVRTTSGISYDQVSYQQNATAGRMFKIVNTAGVPSDSTLRIDSHAAGDNAFGLRVSGDAAARIRILSDGKIQWGSGATTPDTFMYRGSTGIIVADNIVANVLSAAEVWRTLTLANSWTTGSRVTPQYRMLASPAQTVEIIGSLTVPTGFSVGQTIATLPTSYRPTNTQSVIGRNTSVTGVLVSLSVNSVGSLAFQGGTSTTTIGDVLDFHGFISLDA